MTQQETRDGALCFTYFFLVMASYYVLKPIREAFFLHSQGALSFASVHVLVGLATLAATMVYDSLARSTSRGGLVVRANVFFLGCIVGFWALMRHAQPGGLVHSSLAWVFYVGVSIFAVFGCTLFWSLTHNVFTPEQGQRLYGFIGAGGILGGAVGGWLTQHLSLVVGTRELVLLSAGLLSPCVVLGRLLRESAARRAAVVESKSDRSSGSWALLVRDPYVGGIALLVFLTLFIAELGDNQAQRLLERSGLDQDRLTSFYGSLYRDVNAVGLVISLFLTPLVHVRWGPLPGLAALQVVAAVKALALACSPSIGLLRVGLTLDLATHYSIFQASKELLYTPTAPDVKYRAKALIDTFIFRFGLSTGALTILFVFSRTGLWPISLAITALCIASFCTSVHLSRRFHARVRPGEADQPLSERGAQAK